MRRQKKPAPSSSAISRLNITTPRRRWRMPHEQAVQRKYEDFLIVDVDSHHYENEAFREIVEYIDDPVLRQTAELSGPDQTRHRRRPWLQSGDERPHHPLPWPPQGEGAAEAAPRHHADAALDGCDGYRHRVPVPDADAQPVALAQRRDADRVSPWAYNRWLCERILAEEPRIKSMLYLPFHDPAACIKTVEYFTGKPGVIGFMVTSTHHRSVFENDYIEALRDAAGARPPARVPLARPAPTASRRCGCSTVSSACMRSASAGTTWSISPTGSSAACRSGSRS